MNQQNPQDENPYAAPLADISPQKYVLSEENALFAFSGTLGAESYRIAGFADRLRLLDEKTGQVFEISKTEPLFVKLVDWLLIRRTFRWKTGKRLYSVQLEAKDFETLRQWVGPPTQADLLEATGGKSWWQLVVASFFLIPVVGTIGTYRPSLFECVIPAMLITNWIVARVRPHRWLFLLLAGVVGMFVTMAFFQELHFNIGELLVVLFALNLVLWCIYQFRVYRNIDRD